MTKLLEEAIRRVKALPEPGQNIVAELLLGFTDPEFAHHQLSEEQLGEVELAKQEAREGKFASETQITALRP